MAYLVTVPNNVPATLNAGDTWTWQRALDQYAPVNGWTLAYYLRLQAASGTSAVSVSTTGSGILYTVTVSASTTASYAPGEYEWRAYATKGGERYEVERGLVTVLANFATGTYDARSWARRSLDAIKAVLEGRATRSDAMYVLNGMTLQSMVPAQLLALLDRFNLLVRQEESALRASQGQRDRRSINLRFTRPD